MGEGNTSGTWVNHHVTCAVDRVWGKRQRDWARGEGYPAFKEKWKTITGKIVYNEARRAGVKSLGSVLKNFKKRGAGGKEETGNKI